MPDEKNNNPIDQNFAKSLLDAGMSLAAVRHLSPNGVDAPCLVVPEGASVVVPDMEELEPWLERPLRKTGDFLFADPDSFCRYFNEHKDSDSRIFASVTDEGAEIVGHIDFHGKLPTFGQHHCRLYTRKTREWTIWTAKAKEKMNQDAFAQFLEDNTDMFTTPGGAELLELITTLEGKSHVDFTQAVKMQNRAVQLQYSETVELKGGTGNKEGSITLPQLLHVGIAPFEGTARFAMKARLRYRIESRKVLFWYEPVDSHIVVRQVVTEILQHIEKLTGVQPFRT